MLLRPGNFDGEGAATGCGIPPTRVDGVLGVAKAYCTRVGTGPFPTEEHGERAERIRERGGEYGATPGRPRRCGWFDAVAVRYACRTNGVDRIALTKPDVLAGLSEIAVCTGYRYKGQRLGGFPIESWILEDVVPDYRTLPGWPGPLRGVSDLGALPRAFVEYIRVLEDLVETRVAIVSTGVERGETIFIDKELGGLVDLARLRAPGAA